jgi:hypothetical protein
VENLAHSASFHSLDKIAPSNPGIKHLASARDGFDAIKLAASIRKPFDRRH